jgi:membrane AbrB-like protein
MTTSLQTAGRTIALRWTGLLVLSAAFVAVLELLRLPAALLLGPMLAGIIFSAMETTVKVPKLATAISQALVGCLIAQSIPLSILTEMGKDWPIFLGGVVSVIVAGVSLGYILARLQVLPGTTAIWASMPGGASAMSILAESFGADMRLVAFMQYLRVVCVAIAATAISRIWVSASGEAPPAIIWFPPIAVLPMIETVALVAFCIVFSRIAKVQVSIFLMPMILGLVLQTLGLIQIELPPWLLAISYAFIGWNIGLRFTRAILHHAARALPRVLGSIALLIAICCGFAAVLVKVMGVDPLTAYLATSPGGADSVAIIATSTPVDVPFIMAMQLMRLFVILLTGPFIARAIVKWSRLRDEPAAPAAAQAPAE